MDLSDILPQAEQIPLKLRKLYEAYGYKKYKMNKFEQYDLYRENKNFLRGEGILTFTDATGKLMALKPDITMSIIKNAEDGISQKLFYTENVFRMDSDTGEFREISQMGLEYIGGGEGYPESEVIQLAVKSLAMISPNYVLNISHMGFVSELLNELRISEAAKADIFSALRKKNISAVTETARQNALSDTECNLLHTLAGISGPFLSNISRLETVALNSGMKRAVHELTLLYETLDAIGCTKNILLDFSVTNDMDYYNGLSFSGFIEQSPRAVLSGGRYDNMMRRFSKPHPAIGFALYLGELERALHDVREYDVDAILIYGGEPPKKIAQYVRQLTDQGMSVRAEQKMPVNTKARHIYRIKNGGIEEAKNA